MIEAINTSRLRLQWWKEPLQERLEGQALGLSGPGGRASYTEPPVHFLELGAATKEEKTSSMFGQHSDHAFHLVFPNVFDDQLNLHTLLLRP
jgi:hypothetical protein